MKDPDVHNRWHVQREAVIMIRRQNWWEQLAR